MCFYENSRTVVFKNGLANATLYFKSILEADIPLCVLCTQETGFYFWTSHYFFPWGLFVRRKLFFLHLPLRLIWGGNLGFPPFSGPTGPTSWKEWKKGLLRGSLPIKMHMMHSVIILKLSMFVMAHSPLHSLDGSVVRALDSDTQDRGFKPHSG